MDIEWIQHAADALATNSPWALMCLIIFVAYVLETKANRKVTMQSTEALVALKTVIETRFSTTKTPQRRRK
jgi:hypothetical protein